MLQDSSIVQGITAIKYRSEREDDQNRLIRSFVDAGIKPLLMNENNQVVYGRRGTGKTHLLKVLLPEFEKGQRTISVYIDARTLGSTNQFSDFTLPLKQRCLSLFKDILSVVYDALLKYVFEQAPSGSNRALDLLDRLMEIVVNPVEDVRVSGIEHTKNKGTSRGINISGGVAGTGADLHAKGEIGHHTSDKESTTYTVTAEDKIIFPDLQKALRDILKFLDVRLVVLFDEWSSIPLDLQPYLAEFLKRGIIPNPDITLKIASLEHRSQFRLHDEKGVSIVGLEIGADISAGLDLDDYYVYDRSPKRITEIYADILFRHLEPDIGQYLRERYGVSTREQLLSNLFVNDAVFNELSRAAEGVVRDLIQIFTNAALNANRRGRETIDRKAVLEAARQWYEQDKVKELSDVLRKILEKIVSDVIRNRRARAFLIPRDLEKHPIVQGLFDARVLHLLLRGYADKDNPGRRYNIYAIDYGTYADLMNTSTAPLLDFTEDEVGEEFIVPFDDRRSIRRIVLTEEILGAPVAKSNELERKGFGGLFVGDKCFHPSYGVIFIQAIDSNMIYIITDSGEMKQLSTKFALEKIQRLQSAGDASY